MIIEQIKISKHHEITANTIGQKLNKTTNGVVFAALKFSQALMLLLEKKGEPFSKTEKSLDKRGERIVLQAPKSKPMKQRNLYLAGGMSNKLPKAPIISQQSEEKETNSIKLKALEHPENEPSTPEKQQRVMDQGKSTSRLSKILLPFEARLILDYLNAEGFGNDDDFVVSRSIFLLYEAVMDRGEEKEDWEFFVDNNGDLKKISGSNPNNFLRPASNDGWEEYRANLIEQGLGLVGGKDEPTEDSKNTLIEYLVCHEIGDSDKIGLLKMACENDQFHNPTSRLHIKHYCDVFGPKLPTQNENKQDQVVQTAGEVVKTVNGDSINNWGKG